MDVQSKAREALEHFEWATRDDGTRYIRTKDGAPSWVGDMVYAAHAGMLPDDWKYERIHNALEFVNYSGDPEDEAHEYADGEVDTYNADRLEWIASHGSRSDYVDQANDELGGSAGDIISDIGRGQYLEALEVYGIVLQALEVAARGDDDE